MGNGYETILAGEEQLAKMMNLEYGEVRIGASDMTLQFYLLPFLEKFHQKYPDIKVTVTNAPTPQTIDHLHQGRIDFGVVTGPLEVKSPLSICIFAKSSTTHPIPRLRMANCTIA